MSSLRSRISGRVTDAATGDPLPGAILDFWQADDEGHYDLDRFSLYGKVPADAEGRSLASVVDGTVDAVRARYLSDVSDADLGATLRLLERFETALEAPPLKPRGAES